MFLHLRETVDNLPLRCGKLCGNYMDNLFKSFLGFEAVEIFSQLLPSPSTHFHHSYQSGQALMGQGFEAVFNFSTAPITTKTELIYLYIHKKSSAGTFPH